MTIVDAGRSDLDDLAEVEARLREVDREPDSAARVASPEELDESLTVEDEENQFFVFASFPQHLATSSWRSPEPTEPEEDYQSSLDLPRVNSWTIPIAWI